MGLQIVFEVWSEMYMYTGYDERKGFEKKMGSGSQPNGWHSSLRPVEWQSCYLGKYRNVAWRGLPSRAQGSYLTLGNESSKEVRGLTQQDFPGKGPWGESNRVREPKRTLCHVASSLRFYVNGVSFQFVSGQSFWLSPSWWCVHHSIKMDSNKKDSGILIGRMDWSLLSPFDLSWILLVGGSLLVLSMLGRPTVVR